MRVPLAFEREDLLAHAPVRVLAGPKDDRICTAHSLVWVLPSINQSPHCIDAIRRCKSADLMS